MAWRFMDDTTPLGLLDCLINPATPRVGAMRQPWALGHCPFGAIGDGNYSIKMSKLQSRRSRRQHQALGGARSAEPKEYRRSTPEFASRATAHIFDRYRRLRRLAMFSHSDLGLRSAPPRCTPGFMPAPASPAETKTSMQRSG